MGIISKAMKSKGDVIQIHAFLRPYQASGRGRHVLTPGYSAQNRLNNKRSGQEIIRTNEPLPPCPDNTDGFPLSTSLIITVISALGYTNGQMEFFKNTTLVPAFFNE